MTKEIIAAQDAPGAIGPYSQAVRAGGFLFCSGQIALDPKTGELVASGEVEKQRQAMPGTRIPPSSNVAEQAEQVMKNLLAVLTEAGATFGDVVKTTIYLKDMGDFGSVNEVYGKFFTEAPPARATVEVSRLPKDVLVEIDAIAISR